MHRKIEETPEREKMLIRLKELRLERGYSMTQAARKIFSHPDTSRIPVVKKASVRFRWTV